MVVDDGVGRMEERPTRSSNSDGLTSHLYSFRPKLLLFSSQSLRLPSIRLFMSHRHPSPSDRETHTHTHTLEEDEDLFDSGGLFDRSHYLVPAALS